MTVPHSPPKNLVALRISTLISALSFYVASFPGFVSPDTIIMFNEAKSGSYTTVHTPYLSWFWSYLLPTQIGPIGPHLLQVGLFWLGIYFVCYSLSMSLGRAVVFVPPVMLLFDSTWSLSWLWKDSASASFLVLAIGLICRSDFCQGDRNRRVLQCICMLFVALFLMVRVYMFPANLFVLLFFFFYILDFSNQENFGFKKKLRVLRLPITVLIISCVSLQSFTQVVIKPTTYSAHGSAILLQDLMRIKCLTGSNQEIIPRKFIIEGDGNLCDRFSPSGLESLIWYADGYHHLRLAETSSEESELLEIWKSNFTSQLSPLLASRFILFTNFYGASNWIPYPQASLQYWPAGTKTISSEIGWEPVGGLPLLLIRLPSLILSVFPFFDSILKLGLFPGLVFPWLLIAIAALRGKVLRPSLVIGAVFPTAWAFEFSFISAWNDAVRYFIPASWFGMCITLLLLREFNSPRRINGLGTSNQYV
jgi:hypothetical protein